MTTSSKGDDPGELDDPVLRSMRSVWISMRDEEPPPAGLAELLAAARAKAEEMRPREPWWRRAFAAMRRPPVLALATVVVLLGGAIAIGVRRETFEAMPKVEMDRARDPGVTAQLEAPAEAEAAKAKKEIAPAPAAPATEAADDARSGPPGGAVTATPADVPRPHRPARPDDAGGAPAGAARPPVVAATPQGPPAPDSVARPESAERDAVADKALARNGVEIKGTAPPSPPPPPSPQAVPGGSPAANQRLQIADDVGTALERQSNAPAAIDPASTARPRIEGTGQPRGPTVTQLAKQAETAAARGDCAAVRVIMGRLRKLDAAFHKAHVEKHAAVKRCVK